MKLQENFLCAKRKKIMTLFNNFFSSVLPSWEYSAWTISTMSLLPFWVLNASVALLSMQGQKALGFHQNYIHLCSVDEQRSCRVNFKVWDKLHEKLFYFIYSIINLLYNYLFIFLFLKIQSWSFILYKDFLKVLDELDQRLLLRLIILYSVFICIYILVIIFVY